MRNYKKISLIIIFTFLFTTSISFASSHFSDVENHWAETYIEYLSSQGLISGFPDGTFKPNDTLTRAQVSSILSNELNLNPEPANFPDVASSHWANGHIGAVVSQGIMNGYPDGTFKPDNPMTRAEVSAVIASAYNLTQVTSNSSFSDLIQNHWSFSNVMALMDNYIISGYPDSTFKPNNSMTRAEFAAVMSKAINPQFTQSAMLSSEALDIAQVLKDEDMAALANYAHPVDGIRFSPYYYIMNNHQVFTSAQIPNLLSDNSTYVWGIEDGTGFNIDLTPQDYFDRYVNDRDFTNPDDIVYNNVVARGNLINNIPSFYPNAVFVELYVEGTPQYMGMDWRSLYLIFEEYNGTFYLIGIANGEWTI
jgi:hypothetical protein